VNKYLHEHGLAYEGKYYAINGKKPELRAGTHAETSLHRSNDNISHFICRLAYCRNDELRKWFLTQESRLFNLRLQATDPTKIKDIIITNFGLNYETVKGTDPEWRNFSKEITFALTKADERS